ncbi:MAG: hypothetical protein GY953_27215, partial [bacterium]|nr:hypothetical protein [bacterium]
LIILATLYLGALHQRMWGEDVFIFLDGAWRILNGQRPHADFYTGLGPISYLVFAFGISLTDLDASGLGYARASVVLVIGLWSYGLLRRRLETAPLFLFCLLTTIMAGAPVAMGDQVAETSQAAFYNRWGYAVLAILIAEAFLSSGDKRREWRGGISSGVALAVLLFLKASYFFV